MYKLELLSTKDITETEEHLLDRVEWLKNIIISEGIWRIPLIVEKHSLAIMDGHHRYNVAKKIGLTRVPAILLDYDQDNVMVGAWHEDMYIDKEIMLGNIRKKILFPYKTTRHIVSPSPEELQIPLSFLY
jgi:hypothetical protein